MVAFNDVTDAFDGWLEKIQIDRTGAGSYVGGLWVDSSVVIPYINAVVQNANPDDLLIVPEGLRTTESIKLHTKGILKTADEVGEVNADVVNYDCKKWRVYNVADRKIGGYYKAIAIRIKS